MYTKYEQTIPHGHAINAYQICTNYTTLSRFKGLPNIYQLYHTFTLYMHTKLTQTTKVKPTL